MKTQLVCVGALLSSSFVAAGYDDGSQEPLRAAIDPNKYRAACPDYKQYAMRPQYVIKLSSHDDNADNLQPTVQRRPTRAPFSETFKVLSNI